MVLGQITRLITRAPLKSMLTAGLVVFCLDRLLLDPLPSVHISQDLVDQHIAAWTLQAGRAPNVDQLAALIEQLIIGQVLLKKAFRYELQTLPPVQRRLDRLIAMAVSTDSEMSFLMQSALVDQITRQALLSDLVIHNFMMNAMRALLEKSLPPVAISQVEIEEYYHQNSDLFSSPERRSIKHLFKAEHGAKSALEIDELRVKLNNGLISSDEAFKSTDLFYSGALVSGKTHLEIIALFGNQFAQSVSKLEARQWSQPITSVYG
ncbi:MAG TPA: peptidyl-prolyl cis-trans isomerase [Porticoccaceae bacterium]|nr:peptidyl-prolyl cis-trans isomerase [Porticoccaceae bacterium]